jgi:peptidoglycan/xylan/chitin deacetylase (PgdA/CDA1 family)
VARILITIYHRIGRPDPEAHIRGLYATPSIIRRHARLLKLMGYEFMTVSEAVDAKDSGIKIACMTLDDGYRDNFTNGYPVLRDLGIPATVYVVTGHIGAEHHVWDEATDRTPFSLLDWDQIKELKQAGWEIGSHAHEHVHLPEYPVEYQRRVIGTSKASLEEKLGERVRSFAYPYGDFDSSVTSLVKETGFDNAVTATGGINRGATLDPFLLARVPLKGYHLRHYPKALKLLRYLS